MSYTLYTAPGAAGLAAHWMLIEMGVPFEVKQIDLDAGEQKKPEYLKLNPSGMVPTMIVDGEPQAEIAALLMLLAERHPEAKLAPLPNTPGRAAYLRWMVYLANTLQPAFRMWFYADGDGGPEFSGFLKTMARERIEAVWDRVEATLADGRPYLLGDRISAADFLLTMLTRWSRNMPKPATEWPRLGAYIKRMKAMPSLQETHRREGLTEWIAA
jgi:glutathione S-transferase